MSAARPKVCLYGHVRGPNDTYCKPCKLIATTARRKRVEATWRAPIYRELATKAWLTWS